MRILSVFGKPAQNLRVSSIRNERHNRNKPVNLFGLRKKGKKGSVLGGF